MKKTKILKNLWLLWFIAFIPALLSAATAGTQEFGILMMDRYFAEDMALAENAYLKIELSGSIKNPAMLALVRSAQLNSSMVSWHESMQGNNFIGDWPFGGKIGTLGASLLYLGLPSDSTVSSDPLLSEFLLGVSYGNDILQFFDFITNSAFTDFCANHEFKLGMTLKYGHSSLQTYGADILAFDFGFLYRTAIWGLGSRRFLGKNLRIAWSLQNAGFTLWKYSGPADQNGLQLPLYNHLGVAWDFLRDIRHHFTAYNNFKFQNYNPLFNWSIALEYSYLDTISFQAGYSIIGQNAGELSGGTSFKMMLTDWLGFKAMFSTVLNHSLGQINDIQVNLIYRPDLFKSTQKRTARKQKIEKTKKKFKTI